MSDLAEFLLARYDDDRAAWRGLLAAAASADRGMWERLLAECEAKRRIVELHHDGRDDIRYPGDGLDDDDYMPAWCVRCKVQHEGEPWPCETLRLLALPYADHPDFNPDWRP